jgi:hypothetical protein
MIDDALKSQVLAELWELSHQFKQRQKGDITVNDIIEEHPISQRSTLNMLKKLAYDHPDKYELLKIARDNSSGGIPWCWALRHKISK